MYSRCNEQVSLNSIKCYLFLIKRYAYVDAVSIVSRRKLDFFACLRTFLVLGDGVNDATSFESYPSCLTERV